MSDDKAEEIKKNILSPSQWMRILYMAFYAIACWVLLFILPVVIVCQIIISLITGADNRNLRDFGKTLSDYFHQALSYLVYATDEKPWPFSDGEDLGESYTNDDSFNNDIDDDFDDDIDDDIENDIDDDEYTSGEKGVTSTRPSATRGGEDVFSDISFTGEKEKSPDTDISVDVDVTDDDIDDDIDDSNKKDPT